ncbi:MAG: tRNA (adenosine(37)-N6)-threonylcarbamoyltransferase complex ATPase subunit type 1 TsaE [Acidobacteriota bacterium]|nr:tRNA (adenosine(37)-N6)-threonylcarbamoyltransferase complex ATPase subunit type 1 TsaE [Acidobacteriota bacterium]
MWISESEEQTRAIGAELADELRPAGVLLLYGDLGSGKTVLVKGLAEALGIDPETIRSPTYTLIHEHDEGEIPLVHVDLYRLDSQEVAGLGLEEFLEPTSATAPEAAGVVVVEWAERLPWEPPEAVRLAFTRRADGGREIRRLEAAEL